LDEALGLLFLAGYILGVVALAAAVTWAVIKIFPTERNPKKDDKPEKPSENGTAAPSAGSLFRRSKRGASGARESEPPSNPDS
jgi:hypothetical protein